MLFPSIAILLGTAAHVHAQSIKGLGVSGGDGPTGGIGDVDHPIMKPQSFITDALIPSALNTTRQLATGPPPVLVRGNQGLQVCPPPITVVVDSSAKGARQEMVGFGHSWTDSTVSTFESLEADVLDQVMWDLFSPEANNLGFMRNSIGASDMSDGFYSFNDNGPSFNEGEPDLDLSTFDLGCNGTAMAKMIARMGKYKGDVFLYSAPWSFPGWTKHNGLLIAPRLGKNVLNNSFDTQYVPQMVDYFTRYIDTYQREHGVHVNGLSLMNEPLNYQGGYPTMFLDPADEAAILARGLGDALHERGVIAMAYDHNTDQPAYPVRVIEGAPGHVRAAAWHCYESPTPNYSVLDDLHYAYPDLLQFMTECTTYRPSPGTLDFGVAKNFISSVQHGASGASMWVMATDPNYGPHSPYGGCDGCLGSIIVNSSTVYTKTNDYYMIGHFSRFIRRGSVIHRVTNGTKGTNGDSNQFLILAAHNPDQSWAVVFMNNLNSTQNVRLSFTQAGHTWEGAIPNSTVVTWLIPSDQMVEKFPPQAYSSMSMSVAASGSTSPKQTPSYKYPGPYGSPHETTAHPYGFITTATSTFSCPATTTSSSSSSTSSSTSTRTYASVPYTTHVIPENEL